MNDVYDLLVELKNLGARIYSVDDKIKLDIEPGVLSAELSDKIKYYRKDILLILQQSNKRSDFVKIEKLPLQESYATSDGQRRLWILSQFDGGSAAYRISGNLYLDAKINVEIVKKSLWSVLERHESLRTVYKLNASGELRQWILSVEDSRFNIDCQDFRNEPDKVALAESYLAKISRAEFDLENGPLFKVSLIRLEDEDYIVYYDVHHINTDGWSMTVFFNDLSKFYDAYQAGQRPDIAPLKFQYKDYTAWQLQMLADESSNSHRAYWLDRLKGELPRLDLPGHKLRPKILTYHGEAYKGSIIGTQTISRLKKYSEENGGSLFIGLFAAWNVLMYRYTSQEDIIIGTPLNGREHADTIDQIGFYVNTLAIRNKLDPEDNFGSVFNKVRQDMLDAYSHQIYPFNRLVEELNLPKDTGRNAVFDIMLVYNSPDKKSDSSSGGDQSGQMVQVANITSRFDLEIGFREMDNYIQVWGVYNPDIYQEELIESLITHYKRLLDGLMEKPEAKIPAINFLSEEEKHKLLVSYNDTAIPYPKDKTIVDLFEEQVEKTPDNVAVVFEDTELTFRTLNERSNQLAHYLRDKYDIQSDDLIGIKLGRSEWMIVAMLGALKSGGAYVPIDPDYPQERIQAIVDDSKCKVVLDPAALVRFQQSHGVYSTQQKTRSTQSGNLAYVIYTSGSTGKPKGVMVEHRNVVNFFSGMTTIFGEARGIFLSMTNFTFDISVLELLWTLSKGYKVVIQGDARQVNEEQNNYSVYSQIREHKVTHLQITPSMGAILNQYISKDEGWGSIKYILLGGEPVPASLVNDIYRKLPNAQLYNMYGPTETTIWSTVKALERNTERIEIGKPIGNTRIYILDKERNPVAAGVQGEIYIGGAGVARGYTSQALTDLSFIESPFVTGDRLYRTGDFGSWLNDGSLYCFGRKDQQVKIRGYRIELGEIESHLAKYPGITEVSAMINEKDETRHIVAYYVADNAVAEPDLNDFLLQKLPPYMVPTYYVHLDRFPLTTNGKLDRSALPPPVRKPSRQFVPPVTPQEQMLADIWSNVLGIESVGITDSFFELGGHSLSAIKLVSIIKQKMDVQIPIKVLFLLNTITLLLQWIELNHTNNAESMEEGYQELRL